METLFATAGSQFGVFTRKQAHECGLADRQLAYRVGTGVFVQLTRHVFRVRSSPSTWEQQLFAACLAGGEFCVASHRAAAALYAFDGFRRTTVEVTVPRRIRFKSSVAVVHQSLDLEAKDCTYVGPIPTTTPERTLIDLGAVARTGRVEEAFDGAERDSLPVREVVARRHGQVRRQGRNGVGPMAVILDDRTIVAPTQVIERRFLRLVENASLPRPLCQYPVRRPNGRLAYLDAAYPELLLGFELDGHGAHATRSQRASDNTRASDLFDLGWTLRRFTWEQVSRDSAAVVRAVRRALTASSCGPARQ